MGRFKMTTQIQINPGTLIIGVGVLVGGYALWRSVNAVTNTVGDLTDWVTGIPARIAESAREGGATWKENNTAQDTNRQNTPGSYEPVYKDPLMNDDGMNFGLF